MIVGANPPAWPIAFFGVLGLGAPAVPLDSSVEADVADNLARRPGRSVLLADARRARRLEIRALASGVRCWTCTTSPSPARARARADSRPTTSRR
jgi:long-subunit acyl-CoA synthetase (AMP-forming)